MRGAWRLILGLCVASACVSFGLAGCEQGEQGAKPAPTPPAVETSSKDSAPAAVSTDAVKEAVKEVEKATPAVEEPLPPDLVQIKAELTRAKAQIDMTVAKLDVLMASTGDLEKPSEEAMGAIRALEAETKALKSRGDEMRERGAAYFEAWEKELAAMTTAAVKKIAAERKEELGGKYAELLSTMQEARAAFDPFWADLQGIQASIDDGLTPETLKGLSPQVKKVKDAAPLLKGRLDAVRARVDQVASIYTNQ